MYFPQWSPKSNQITLQFPQTALRYPLQRPTFLPDSVFISLYLLVNKLYDCLTTRGWPAKRSCKALIKLTSNLYQTLNNSTRASVCLQSWLSMFVLNIVESSDWLQRDSTVSLHPWLFVVMILLPAAMQQNMLHRIPRFVQKGK